MKPAPFTFSKATTIDECLSVRRSLDKPMVLDESVASLDDMLDIHRKGAADGLTLKISRLGGARERSKPTGWDRTRLSVLIPLGLVVAAAIICIVVAALTSAQRANDVALKRERQLLTRAIATHGEWSLIRLRMPSRIESNAPAWCSLPSIRSASSSRLGPTSPTTSACATGTPWGSTG